MLCRGARSHTPHAPCASTQAGQRYGPRGPSRHSRPALFQCRGTGWGRRSGRGGHAPSGSSHSPTASRLWPIPSSRSGAAGGGGCGSGRPSDALPGDDSSPLGAVSLSGDTIPRCASLSSGAGSSHVCIGIPWPACFDDDGDGVPGHACSSEYAGGCGRSSLVHANAGCCCRCKGQPICAHPRIHSADDGSSSGQWAHHSGPSVADSRAVLASAPRGSADARGGGRRISSAVSECRRRRKQQQRPIPCCDWNKAKG